MRHGSDKTLQVGYANHFYRSAHKFEQICRHRLRRQNVRSEERRVGKECRCRWTAYEIGLGIPAEPLFRSAIKLCRLDTPIIFIEARINLSRFVVTGCAAKTSATVTFPSLNLISLFAFCFNIWLNGVAS